MLYATFDSPGSVIADLEATLLSHPDAECTFINKLNNLNFTGDAPDVHVNTGTCKYIYI